MLQPAATMRRLPAPLRVVVLAHAPERGAGLARRVAGLGHAPLGPLRDDEPGREAAAGLGADLCLIELPPVAGGALLVATEVGDRRESRGLAVRLVEPATDAELQAAIGLALDRACELRLLERQADAPSRVMRDVDAVVRAKAVLRSRFGMSERHASRRLRAAAQNRSERLADTARRVWDRRGSIEVRAEAGIAA
ncbi:ANTAR domain-containing response regulator [Conexibacter woesei]|uniref:ANTAR domain-containing protein n=1 Tax=Conexibacter woesei (strain DSM 14684 / CCUG 47730 / CIP 108061 / JCM 11494 / NBRC 100937 / ID131577) TaxID=469383 RepID=D3FDF7_CONWI|nr:ANTAR domain-containing protein [Conexibacter woesei]ADB53549.1 ANTAR domain protein with unknown sensor [Conexibacter woesei DSM 14684]